MASRGSMWFICLLVGLSVLGTSHGISLNNADFEATNYNGNWDAVSCTLSPSNDAYSGSHSIHVSNRHQNWNGLSQHVAMQGGHAYKVIVYVKLLSTVNSAMFQEVHIVVNCKDQHGKDFYKGFGGSPHAQAGQWYAVGGVNRLPAGSHGCRVYVETKAPTEYLADNASIQEVTSDSNWMAAANQRIGNLRKADVTIKLTGSNIDSTSVSVELSQQRHEFGFGSEVNVDWIQDSTHHAYQQAFYDIFDWAVFGNALKWYATEPHQGQFHYDKPLHAISVLHNHGIKVRGHNVFWAVDKFVQSWVKGLSKSALTTEMNAHIQRVIGKTRGLLEHWDVNNENLHGEWYETHTGDPNITMDMFRKVHAIDSKPKLFINEYNVISNNDVAVALMDKAKRFKAAGVPIGGIGVQGHLHHLDIPEIWERLNILGEAGLPIWITELGINDKNENSKATKLEQLLTLFYSHPAVEGVVFWGFSDQKIWEHDAALFTGSGVTPNAAGRKLQELLKTTWRTHMTHTVHGNQPWHTRAFKGEYQLTVKHNGHVIKTETFSLSAGGQSLQIHVDGQQNGHPHVSHVLVG